MNNWHFNVRAIMALCVCTLLTLSSCEKVGMDETTDLPTEQTGTPATLTMSTRNGDSGTAVAEGRIYVFNSLNQCVQLLSTDANNTSVNAQFPAGSYSIYAIGGEDLSHYALPSLSDATPTSVITHYSDKLINELLFKQTEIILEEGEERDLNITLDRKVLCLDRVEMTQMPADVTKVEVTLTSFYSSMSFDGTYPNTPVESCRIILSKQTDGTTWSADPAQMLFPSKGTPVVTVSITTTTGTSGFTFNAATMVANKHYTVSGTYSVTEGATLTCTLTAVNWDEDASIDIDLDNDHQTVYAPVAGQFCNGYYVVSVDATARTAVLLAKSKLSYVPPTETTDAAAWLAALTPPMEILDKPTGITNSWRLPTIEETAIFSKDPQIATFNSDGISTLFFCTDGDILKSGWSKNEGNDTYSIHKSTTLASRVHLRPVIDINY